jgi:hypothetical protein
MSFFNLITDLRKGVPDLGKAANAMKFLGWVCLLAGFWNYFMPSLMPFEKSPFNIPPDYPALALGAFLFLGALFFLAGRGIANRDPWGKRLAQSAIVLLVVVFVGLLGLLFSRIDFPFSDFPRPILVIFSIIFVGQFVVPAWFGIRYLGRLPVREDGIARHFQRPPVEEHLPRTGPTRSQAAEETRYKDTPVPFGLLGTLVALIAVPMVVIMLSFKFGGPESAATIFLPFFIAIFLGPVLYNRVASPFEQGRILIASYIGGGSTFLMNGSWPFFRLLIYADGVEVRVMFHRFFIPYDRMEDLPEKLGFFSRGILFQSDLPGVPTSIRFYGSRNKDILAQIRELRSRFLAQKKTA